MNLGERSALLLRAQAHINNAVVFHERGTVSGMSVAYEEAMAARDDLNEIERLRQEELDAANAEH